MNASLSRRRFLGTLPALATTGLLPATMSRAAGPHRPHAGRIYKAVKGTMIRGGDTLLDQFRMAREAGFDGITLFAPDRYDLKEALHARDTVGLPVHNINNTHHWKVRLTDPDPHVRDQALNHLKQALEFAHAVGASSVLQVIGKVTDEEKENHSQVWERSITQIRKALPLAARLGVRILCENVGNGFCADPREWAAYLDEIGNPWCGAFFDIGNHERYGGAPHWIRTLGRQRIVKIDVKDHDTRIGKNVNLFDGTVNWPEVREALTDIQFSGWATAEVQGGGLDRLRLVAQHMDQALGL